MILSNIEISKIARLGPLSICICHKSKMELVILKLDFDKVEHEVIMRVMEQKGSPER